MRRRLTVMLAEGSLLFPAAVPAPATRDGSSTDLFTVVDDPGESPQLPLRW